MTRQKIICGDNNEVLKDFADNSIDSCVTDPPYGLKFMGKKWDYEVPKVELWKEVYRVLKPGAHILVACGTRTQHRMAVNIEDAGFEIRDIISWIYGSGFPKSLDISKAIDRQGGQSLSWFIDYILNIADERKISRKELTMLFPSKNGNPTGWLWNKQKTQGITLEQFNTIKEFLKLPFDSIEEAEREIIGKGEAGLTKGKISNFAGETEFDITAPSTDEAKQWNGWGTALKPAQELWTLARKPLSEKTVAENVLKHGTGGINIDVCRIRTNEVISNHSRSKESAVSKGKYGDSEAQETHQTNGQQLGRFPANLILDEFMASELDKQTGILTSGHMNTVSQGKNYGIYGKYNGKEVYAEGDSGGASRFFYCAKADGYERNKGLGQFEKGEPPASARSKPAEGRENALGNKRANFHPTVKPIDLMRYLVRLITPKGATILDPFNGSGTTGIAAKLEFMNYIGIEKEEDYCKISEARIAATHAQTDLFNI